MPLSVIILVFGDNSEGIAAVPNSIQNVIVENHDSEKVRSAGKKSEMAIKEFLPVLLLAVFQLIDSRHGF